MITKVHIRLMTQASEEVNPEFAAENAQKLELLNRLLQDGGQVIGQFTKTVNGDAAEGIFIIYSKD